MTEVQVLRPDGSKVKIDMENLKSRLLALAKGLDPSHIKVDKIMEKVQMALPEEITQDQLVELCTETLATMATIHPDHAVLAARLGVEHLKSKIPTKFSDCITRLHNFYNTKTKRESPLVSKKVHDVVMQNAKLLDDSIVQSRDSNLTFFGLKTLEKAYLLKIDEVPAESPQFMLMRVSLGIHGDDIQAAIETYNLMSEKYFIHASPTLFNSGTPMPYLSSCFLLGVTDDSIDGIYKTLHRCALISKAAGGIGLHVSNIRAAGSYIAGSNGISNGLVPMLRVYNNTARYVDQGGNKRPGAFAIYLEPWHNDIFDFLDLRKNHGKEEMRARDLFYALWIPDLFMEKVQRNEDWALFSPDEAKGLNELYGDEFVQLYNRYVDEGLAVRTIKAQKLWHAILESQVETGGPFMLYKDACNKKTNQKNLGTIKSSNLCCEVVQYSSPEEVAVCNLASLALPTFVKSDEDSLWFDFEKLHEVTKVLTRNLNKVIDVGAYPVPEAEISNKKHRPIAIGVNGLSDLFMQLRLPFDGEDAKMLNIQIFETIYHAAVEASTDLALEYGVYETFNGSPASYGKLQFDLWNHKPTEMYDWDGLKSRVVKYGLRNSLLVAPMPTASTSQIMGFNECFEPLTSNIYTRRVLSGEFQVVNKYLVEDLIQIGLWDEDMKNRIIDDNGSIANIGSIPDDIKALYKTVWEISQKRIIDMAADRAPFIDQSQSMNVHIKDPTMGKLTSMHFYGWKKGLKTGMYYLRTQAASAAIKFTIDRSVTPVERTATPTIKRKKRVYTPVSSSPLKRSKIEVSQTLGIAPGSLSTDDTPESPLTPNFNDDSYGIHDSTPLSCNLSDSGGACDSCSG